MVEQTLIILEQLTKYAVNVKTETFIDGRLVNTERKSYINDERDREQVQSDLPKAQATAIFAVWDAE